MDYSGVKVNNNTKTNQNLKNSSITYTSTGYTASEVGSLLAGLQTPAPAPVVNVAAPSSPAPAAAPAAAPADTSSSSSGDTAASVLSDSINKNPKVWGAIAAIVAVLTFLYFFGKK